MPRDPFDAPGDPAWMREARRRPYPEEVTRTRAMLEHADAKRAHRRRVAATEPADGLEVAPEATPVRRPARRAPCRARRRR